MSLSIRSLWIAFVGIFSLALLAPAADGAAPTSKYRTRAPGRYAMEQRLERARAAAEEDAEAAEAEADYEVVDEEYQEEPIGTGTKNYVRQAAYQMPTSRVVRRNTSFSGPATRGGRMQQIPEEMSGEFYTEGPEVIEGPPPHDVRMQMGEHFEGGEEYADYAGGCGPAGCGFGNCFGPRYDRRWNGGGQCGNCCVPCLRFGYWELFAGAHGFTGPANRGGSGSFGFHEGANAGIPLFCGITAQAGVMATQSNLDGSALTPDDRTQLFVTAGGFRRVDLGLQAGVVVDYLHDEWDYSVDLAQIRGEIGWRLPCDHELGFWFAAGIDQSQQQATTATFTNSTVTFRQGNMLLEPVDIYAFYYRRQFCSGGEGRIFGGFTDDQRGLLGGNIRLPMNPCWQFSTDFIYVVPQEDAQRAYTQEIWNVSFNLVWTPFGNRNGGCQNYCRPLLDVANNASFLTRIR